ncbi:DNA-binding protein HU [Candidatus Pantoea edessiphila]|uniref:DNA-binding protein HU-beta n=1 Tax=Candidatus Pantoea edessiphila TaxID=2044610 RepID=A0A2P5SXF9_9GAMM|nr:HU family DNA-binding protein [Candidatus Pantoea edessiphila]MBK4775803.1 HU family DNA-binding protein [Pantoea sp. Edef]PPI87015.1 DNA-binding protein HU [Candidatus Pantoea edessiphila]
MNKSQLINKIALDSSLPKAVVGRVLNAFTGSISSALKQGDDVVIIGFGTFSVRNRAARVGRNPQTGQEINIPAGKIPGFRAGKTLKNSVN